MSTDRRRAAARRRAWGRGPMILRLEPLEGRALLSTTTTTALLPNLVGASFSTQGTLTWGDTFQVNGSVLNQGGSTVTTPFQVNFYASPTVTLNPSTEVYLGQATIPTGLAANQAAPIDQILSMPTTPISGIATGGTVYVEMVIDPQHAVKEASTATNTGGLGYNIAAVTIGAPLTSNLSATSLTINPASAKWGSTITVNDTVQNNGSGVAPATRARVVLTPSGSVIGGLSDFTIGNIQVPAIAPNTTAQVSGNVTLPTVPPAGFVGVTSYTLSVVQDAGFLTNQISPHIAGQGLRLPDQIPITIAAPANPNLSLGHKPDLTPTLVVGPTQPITLGQTFQVGTTIQNKGKGDAGPFTVRFLLVGTSGDISEALFLGDAQLTGLQAGYSQNISQTITFPSSLPAGLTINTQGRIAVQDRPREHHRRGEQNE